MLNFSPAAATTGSRRPAAKCTGLTGKANMWLSCDVRYMILGQYLESGAAAVLSHPKGAEVHADRDPFLTL